MSSANKEKYVRAKQIQEYLPFHNSKSRKPDAAASAPYGKPRILRGSGNTSMFTELKQ